MSRGKKAAIATGIVCVVFVIIFASVCAFVSSTAINDFEAEEELRGWMGYLKDETLIKQAVIPGSHDAGSMGMFWLCETQNLTIKEQLDCGVRYFDIRIQKTKDDYVIFHGPAKGVAAEKVFSELREFVSEQRSETLLLDFQHFKGDSEEGVARLISEYLGEYVLKNDSGKSDLEFIDELSIGEARGKCIVFWGSPSDEGRTADAGFFLRNDDNGGRAGSCLTSFYDYRLNILSPTDYVKKALPEYMERNAKLQGITVLQGQLTDGFPVFTDKIKINVLGPRFQEGRHQYAMSDFVNGLKDSPSLDCVNIIMRDYINPVKAYEIIRLNLFKNNVKEDCAEFFSR
ncbi:MAG: phosphatidylinositol-specific phospholipase C domain-containing protein [Christensenellales bacterium]